MARSQIVVAVAVMALLGLSAVSEAAVPGERIKLTASCTSSFTRVLRLVHTVPLAPLSVSDVRPLGCCVSSLMIEAVPSKESLSPSLKY
jgi:hypothetical protein